MKKIFFLALLTPALNAMHHEMGEHNFSQSVEKEWESLKNGFIDLPSNEVMRIKKYFKNHNLKKLPKDSILFDGAKNSDEYFARWVSNNVLKHVNSGYSIVNVSLKKPGDIPGFFKSIF